MFVICNLFIFLGIFVAFVTLLPPSSSFLFLFLLLFCFYKLIANSARPHINTSTVGCIMLVGQLVACYLLEVDHQLFLTMYRYKIISMREMLTSMVQLDMQSMFNKVVCVCLCQLGLIPFVHTQTRLDLSFSGLFAKTCIGLLYLHHSLSQGQAR